MSIITATLQPRRAFGPHDETLLWHVIQVMNRVDGTVEPGEAQLAEALSRTVPQLRAGRSDARPVLPRKALLDELQRVSDVRLARQIFVVALEAALASGDVNESEDQYLEHVRRALKIDDAFATQAAVIVGAKYGR